jgi:hypothetical protein
MTRFGLDSTGEVPVWAHHAVGSSVALRYLSRSDWKVVTRSEHEHYKAAGIDLVLVFEDMGRPDLSDYAGGKADAEFALGQATGILGKPAMAPVIRFAADFDVNPQATDAYYDGCAAVLGHDRCGPYGSYRVVAHARARGFQALWQTYAWSAGQQFLGASAYQYSNGHTVGGVGVDYNHLYGADFGQWDRKAPVPLDPNHYGRLTDEGYAWKGRILPHERPTAIEYDHLRALQRRHVHPFRARLHVLEQDLRDLADHVYFEAHDDRVTIQAGAGLPFQTPPSWGAFWRGWRYRELTMRARGQRVA